MKKNDPSVFQIKVTLRHISPPIWRRIEVPADIKLGRFHKVLQTAMGWTESHLHAFRAGGVSYGVPDPDADFSSDMQDERPVRLDRIAGVADVLVYEYDFGDGWEHDVEIEKQLAADATVHYPRCIAGNRACPPEDCGGPPGYAHLLDVLRDAAHEEHEDLREWVGGSFDPEAFDLGIVNKRLWRAK